VIVAFFALNFVGINFARSAAISAAMGVWLPTLVFIAVGLIARWWSRPQLIQQDC
jgi:lipopolysaccharide export LptBFGC system permease protein LptF